MLWTVVPEQLIFDEDDNFSVAEMNVGNVTVVVQVGADGSKRVQRLLSTNPRDYLRPEWQPGIVWNDGERKS